MADQGKILSAVSEYVEAETAELKAQILQLTAQRDTARGDVADLTTKVAELQKRIDELTATGVLMGANVGPQPDESLYPKPLPVARTYLKGGDRTLELVGFNEAYDTFGARNFVTSHAGSAADFDAAMAATPTKTDVTRWMVRQHEPFIKVKQGLYTYKQWQDEQRRASKICRAKGIPFGFVLMAWDLKGIGPDDRWTPIMGDLDPSIYDFGGFDYYPDNNQRITITDAVGLMDGHMKAFGNLPWIVGEFGVGSQGPTKAAAQATEMRQAIDPLDVPIACWFSVGENALTTATRDAWFA